MASTRLRASSGALLQALLEAQGQGLRARTLLDAVAREPWVQACALWFREREGWTCILARGAPEQLPDRDFLEEVAAGSKPADFVPGRGVLLAGKSEGALALCWAGSVEAAEADLDLVAALLHVACLVDRSGSEDHAGLVEALAPALPHPEPDCQPARLLAELRERIGFELELEGGVETCRVGLAPTEFVRALRGLVSNTRVALRRGAAGELILALDGLRDSGPEDLRGRIRIAEGSASGTKIEFVLPLTRPT